MGALVLAGGYVIWSRAPNLWVVFLGLSIIAPFGMSSSWVPCNATVVRWYIVRRGLATGISSAGGSAANIVVPLVAAWLVDHYGWRTALASMALVGAALMLASAAVLVRTPEAMGQLPDGLTPDRLTPDGGPDGGQDRRRDGGLLTQHTLGANPRAAARAFQVTPAAPAPAHEPESTDLTAAQAWRSPIFWKMFGAYGLTFSVVFVPFLHLVQFTEQLGSTRGVGAGAISAIGIGGLLGRVITGPLSDRLDRRVALIVTLLLEAAAFGGMAVATNPWMLYPSAIAFGLAYGGGVAVFPALVGDYFGRAHAGAIVGRIFATAGAVAAIGPYLAQVMFDALGSYRWVFALCALANLAGWAVALLLPNPQAGRPQTGNRKTAHPQTGNRKTARPQANATHHRHEVAAER